METDLENIVENIRITTRELQEAGEEINKEQDIGWAPKKIFGAYLRIKRFLLIDENKINGLEGFVDETYNKTQFEWMKKHKSKILWSVEKVAKKQKYIQRPLDYGFAFGVVGAFFSKEQKKFCKVLDIEPWIATCGNASIGTVVGASYYLGPGFVFNAYRYLTGENGHIPVMSIPQNLIEGILFVYAFVNTSYDGWRIKKSIETKEPRSAVFGSAVIVQNFGSIKREVKKLYKK